MSQRHGTENAARDRGSRHRRHKDAARLDPRAISGSLTYRRTPVASKAPAAPVSAFHEILSWSADRPDWQRDALRRIVVSGTVDEPDLRELERICRAKHSLDPSTAPPIEVDPLVLSHLPPGPGFETSVTLVSIGNLHHVNRIPSDQTLIFGQGPGLTVVSGNNGSGKSGYARVIKKACRSRGALPTIRPNAFAP